MVRQYNVIDADGHCDPLPDFWQVYLPKDLRANAPRIEHGDDVDYVVFEGERRPHRIRTPQAGKTKDQVKRKYGRLAEGPKGAYEAAARCQAMDQDGVDAAVIYGGGPLASKDLAMHVASFDAYNRWLADFCKGAPDRLFGIAYIPTYDVDKSIAQLKLAHSLGLRGAVISAFPQSVATSDVGMGPGVGAVFALTGDANGKRTYADPEFDPLWRTAAELGMPIEMHLGARNVVRLNEPRRLLADSVMVKVAMIEPIAIFIYGGVFARHPKLRFVTVESGVGFFAYAAAAMDETWRELGLWNETELPELPSYYMAHNVFGTFLEDPVGIEMRRLPGASNIMWSSDYPHATSTWPNSQAVIDRILKGVPEADRQAIVCGNARKLYNLG